MDPYLQLKCAHILSGTVLFGAGLGTAAHMWMTHRTGSVPAIAAATANTVRADWWFTASSGALQPATGAGLIWMGGHDPFAPWLLAAYALYLQEVFTVNELRSGTFVAVGAVHRTTEVDKVPRSVARYWPQYDYELSGSEPKPDTFCRYVVAGRQLVTHGEFHAVLDKIAEAVLRLARMLNPKAVIEHRRRSHQQVLQLLADQPMELGAYRRLITAFGIGLQKVSIRSTTPRASRSGAAKRSTVSRTCAS